MTFHAFHYSPFPLCRTRPSWNCWSETSAELVSRAPFKEKLALNRTVALRFRCLFKSATSVGATSSSEYRFQNRNAPLYLTCITPCEAQHQCRLLLVLPDK